jgi:hypothetical protein
MIMVTGNFLIGLVIGLIYDVFGRKTPILIFLLIVCTAFIQVPFMTCEADLVWFAICLITLPCITANPFVPDLFHESSHGMGNMLRTNLINLGNLSAYGLLLMNATGYYMFSSNVLFSACIVVLLATFVMVKIGMKDVIKDGGKMTESSSE